MPVAPLWVEQPKSGGLTLYMYAGAAAVVLIMLMMILNSTNIIQLPWPSSSSSAGGAVQRSSTPTGSDYARADRFVNVYLTPSLLSIGHTLPALQSACTGPLSSGCLTALNAAKDQVTELLSNLDHADVPPCIAAGEMRTRADFQSMADGLDLSLNGYQNNNGAQVYQGINHFAYSGRLLKPDAGAVSTQKARCSKVTPA